MFSEPRLVSIPEALLEWNRAAVDELGSPAVSRWVGCMRGFDHFMLKLVSFVFLL